MPRPTSFQDMELKNFSGLDLRGPSELLSERSLASLINMEVGDVGQLKSRPGFKQIYNGSAFGNVPCRFIGHHTGNTHSQILIQTIVDGFVSLHGAGKIFVSSDGGVTFTQISTPAGTNYQCGRSSQYGSTYGTNIPSSSGLLGWDGATFTTPISGTKGSSYNGFFAQDRYFTIEDSSGQLWFSDPGNAASYPGANTIGFTVDNKDKIVGIVPYRDRVVIFFQNSIRVLYTNGPPSSWILKFLPFYMGVRTQDCYYVYRDLIYFLSSEGFFRTDLSQLEELSKPIAPVFQTRWEAYELNAPTYNKYTDAIGFWRDRFIISLRTRGASTPYIPTHRMFMYNIRNGAWSEIIPNISNSDSLPFSPSTSFMSVFMGRRAASVSEYVKEGLYMLTGDSSGRLFCFDDEDPVYYDGTSNATNFITTMRTKDIDADLPSEQKRSPRVAFRYRKTNTTTVNTKMNVNGTDQAVVPVSSNSTASKQVRLKGPGYFRKFSLEISDTSDQYVEIEGVTVTIKRKNELSETTT
jgi:hypothetical protein